MTGSARNVRRVPALLALLAVLLAALGGALFSLRPARPAAGSPAVTFTQGMIRHHDQAVTMARLIRARPAQRSVRSLALDIELSQTEQVRQMRGWLTLLGQGPGPEMTDAHARTMGMATGAELASLRTLPPATAQAQFLRLMIRHHQGAVAMVDGLPERGLPPEVQRIARQIRASQQGEIVTMNGLLKRLGKGAPPVPAAPHHH